MRISPLDGCDILIGSEFSLRYLNPLINLEEIFRSRVVSMKGPRLKAHARPRPNRINEILDLIISQEAF